MVPSINQVEINDVISRSPQVLPLDSAWLLKNPPRFLVCSQGFEQRYDAIASCIVDAGLRLDGVVVLGLRSNSVQDKKNGEKLIELLTPHSATLPILLDADARDFPSQLVAAIGGEDALNDLNTHVVLDISTAANRMCIRSLNILIRRSCCLTIAYTEAAVYHPQKSAFNENESAWMSDEALGTEKGVSELRVCEEFAGEHLEAASNVVVLFPSFRHERSAAVIGNVDQALLTRPTDDVIWILGRPHLEIDSWRVDAMRKINRIVDEAKVYEASTFDFREAWQVLEMIYRDRWEASNITVSPLGSKMQALAVTLFCIRHSDIRVLFSTPQQYNVQQWSEGVRALWRVSIGSGSKFLDEIFTVGKLRLEGITF